jgi:predicted secreted protein
MTSALAGFGTLLKIGDGGGTEVFTTIAEVTDISGPKFKMETVEVTSHTSTGSWKERIPTLLDAGEISCKLNFIPTGATHSQTSGLLKDMKNKARRNFKLVFPDTGATTWTFAAYVTGFETGEPIDGALTADVTLTIDGAPTLAG